MESMWSILPVDILERVFTFLPIASVCRFRILSKSWNRYLNSHAFTHAQTSNVSPEEYVLIPQKGLDRGWNILDMAKRRFLTFSDDFLRNYVQQQGLAQLGNKFWKSLEAAAGGLFCVRYLSYNTGVIAHFMCNPVLKTVKQLPHLVGWDFFQKVVMSTDRVSMEYEIIVVFLPNIFNNTMDTFLQPNSIFVYGSKTSNWRQAPYKPMNRPVNYPNYQVCWSSLTIFRNLQYYIVNKGSSQGIVSYNKETGEVSNLVGVDIPWVYPLHLVVSRNRLFYVILVKNDTYEFPSIEIFEINIAKKESNLLTEMPQDLLIWVFGHDLERRFCRNTLESNIKVVIGSADSIFLICTLIGRFAVYSLSKNYWYQYRDHSNLLEASLAHITFLPEYYVSSYCLSLCPP